MSNKIRVRFAPSPTGYLHIGSLRTAFYNYLFAKKNRGELILRIEDTDQKRYVKGSMENLLATLESVGLEYNEGPYFNMNKNIVQKGDFGPYLQSERLEIYQKHAQILVKNRQAYYCFCSTEDLEKEKKKAVEDGRPYKYSQKCCQLTADEIKQKIDQKTPYVIRLKVPNNQIVEFEDIIRGKISFNTNDVDDQVLIKSDGFPTYHLANIVDDYLMEISHVIRGEEWLPSTPKHILLYRAFEWDMPKFAHLPLLLNKDKSKLSKRQGDVGVEDYLAKGYLPEALLNFVLLLGWNPGTDQEIFSLKEMQKTFNLEKVHKSGAVFDLEKLDWMNGMYIRKTDIKDLTKMIIPYFLKANLLKFDEKHYYIENEKIDDKYLEKVVELEKDRIKNLAEITELVEYLFTKEIKYEPEILVWKKSTPEQTKKNLQNLLEFLKTLDKKDFSKEKLEEKIKNYISKNDLGVGDVLWPMRVALTGKQNSPGPFEVTEAISLSPWGKELVFERITAAIEKL